ncbi:PREDICTED: cell division cycle and apoptosis regulator protein 1-like isoform X1 [Polistes canadensis]|uniref:cell division cycle and apoptosis regulator protein 1-like isoform X1 n=1 Tax=Polistes canadensis TaxID=91411 RepID=UPI000718C0B0|nr:PREDICTED: cell division cycle and apoptosis regulator protein 1-like isoform X1 [Polistes canadensis]
MSNLSPFGGGKNPPWVRNTGQGIQNIQQQMLGQAMGTIGGQPMVQYQQQTQQVYQQSLGLQQPNITMASMATLGSNLPSGIAGQLYSQVATVSYPTPRALNTNAFQQSVAGVPQQVQQNVPSSSPKQRVFTGTVTKVHDNFGFVDEDVFFQTSACVKGSNPIVGDRVLVEASYNPSMPFKWNATRIQVLPMVNNSNNTNTQQTNQGNRQQQQVNRPSGTYNAVPPPAENSNNRFSTATTNTNMTSNRNKVGRVRERSPRERRNEEEEIERKRRREERIREREKKEERSPSRTRRSKSPRPRRRTRVVPRYMVQIPKIALDLPEADVLEIRRRYQNMYIPSDFFSTNFRWVDAFPPHMPFTLNKPCSFHVMHKDVDPCTENAAVLEPTDADYLFSAKVMLISMPAMEEIYKRCCGVSEDRDPDRDYIHPTRLINFLVGLRGKNETMAIGGPWSPSLDGPNPEKDPSVLIRTAVRTCKALTGIDLSSCTQWYRFLELYYRRAETTHKSGRVVPSRVETVILFLPDVWSCVPTRLEWDGLQLNYKKQLERKLLRAASNPDDLDAANDTDEAAVADQKDDMAPEKKDPTHYSQLDPKSMNVNDLRQELVARNLSSKGLKSQLLARLLKAIKLEQAKEEGRQDDVEDNEDTSPPPKEDDEKKFKENKDVKHDEDKRKLYERERAILEKRYTLPESSHIIVHPSRSAKNGKFDCTVMSLSVLLDYRPEDTKEHSFEVSLFAELFNEMLMRDFGFRIYRSLCNLPERPKEKDEDKKKDKKDDKRDEKKDDRRREDDRKCNKKEERRDDKKREGSKDKKDDKEAKSKTDEKDRDKEKNDDEEDDDFEESEDDDSVKDGKKDRDKDGKKRKTKLYTYDPYLLLSFVYFDQTHCGYIFDKDIEELIYTLGLNLSRAQVRKLVQKVVTRDSLHYRKLTDKAKDDNGKDEKDADKNDNGKTQNEEDLLRSLALGNKKLLPVFVSSGPPSKRARRDDKSTGITEEESIPEGFVLYKGSLLDVEKLIGQLKRSEKARVDTENRMIELQNELGIVNEKSVKQGNNLKGLSEDLKIYKDKLRCTDEKLKKVSTECHSYLTAVKNMYHIASKMMQGDNKKVEVVEIQDEKIVAEVNGSEIENKCKIDTRWGDSKSVVKEEIEKDRKCDNKISNRKEITESDKEKK